MDILKSEKYIEENEKDKRKEVLNVINKGIIINIIIFELNITEFAISQNLAYFGHVVGKRTTGNINYNVEWLQMQRMETYTGRRDIGNEIKEQKWRNEGQRGIGYKTLKRGNMKTHLIKNFLVFSLPLNFQKNRNGRKVSLYIYGNFINLCLSNISFIAFCNLFIYFLYL